MTTLELARPLLKKISCAACIMCRALVFHSDPAAPVPTPAVVDLSLPFITAPLLTSQLLFTTHHNSSQLITTHHNSSQLITTHHNSSQLITAPLLIPHSSQPHCSSQLITTYHIPAHHSSTSHTSLITGPLLITTHHSSTYHTSLLTPPRSSH